MSDDRWAYMCAWGLYANYATVDEYNRTELERILQWMEATPARRSWYWEQIEKAHKYLQGASDALR